MCVKQGCVCVCVCLCVGEWMIREIISSLFESSNPGS